MSFDELEVGTRRRSSVTSLQTFSAIGTTGSPSRRLSIFKPPAPVTRTDVQNPSEVRRTSLISIPGVRRRSSAVSISGFDNRKPATSVVDEPVLLSKEKDTYIFFSMTSDGILNYKLTPKIHGSMTKYLVDGSDFNPEGAPVVVLSSPASGTGNAREDYNRLVLPILKHFKVAHSHICLKDKVTTSYIGANGQFTPDTIFILLSGDGVIHELINALAKNPHFSEPGTQIRICPVPCGSGNGLSSSLKIASVAQGIRNIFKGTFQPLPLVRVRSLSLGTVYSAVVVSWGLHAALVDDSDSADYRQRYGNERFKEAATHNLYPKPHSYRGSFHVRKASRFPDFGTSARQRDVALGDSHTYVLITRCCNLEATWKIAPMASPIKNPTKLDVVRMGNLSGEALGSILMDGYKCGAQINNPDFEYYRVESAKLTIGEKDERWRRICIDGAIHLVDPQETIEVDLVTSLGKSGVRMSVRS